MHSPAWFESSRPDVGQGGATTVGTRGLIAWNCGCPDKLSSNINKHIGVGQYPQEGSTMCFASPPQWTWNNTTLAEITPRAGPKPTCWAKLEATAPSERGRNNDRNGKRSIRCWHSQVHASWCGVSVTLRQDLQIFTSTATCCKAFSLQNKISQGPLNSSMPYFIAESDSSVCYLNFLLLMCLFG